MLLLRLVISVASAVSAVSVDPLPDQRLSLVLMQVSDLALLRLRPVASASVLLRLRRVASASVSLRLRRSGLLRLRRRVSVPALLLFRRQESA